MFVCIKQHHCGIPTSINLLDNYRRKFRSQTSDNLDRWKSRGGKSQRREEKRRRDKIWDEKEWEERRCRYGKRWKSRHSLCFLMIWGSGGSKSRHAKAAGAEPSGQVRDEKVHAVVARSTSRSQNVQNTSCSDRFWKLRCRKSARRLVRSKFRS